MITFLDARVTVLVGDCCESGSLTGRRVENVRCCMRL